MDTHTFTHWPPLTLIDPKPWLMQDLANSTDTALKEACAKRVAENQNIIVREGARRSA